MEKNNLLDKIKKLSLPASILISAIILGSFYFAVEHNKQRSIERQQQTKIEQEKQDQIVKELKGQQSKEEAVSALSSCIANVEERYHDQWLGECKAQGKLSVGCLEVVNMTREEYTEKYGVPLEQYSDPIKYIEDLENLLINRNKKLAECSCGLALSLADRVNDSLEKNKAECFMIYPQQ